MIDCQARAHGGATTVSCLLIIYSHTSFNLLKLPEYSSADILKARIEMAIAGGGDEFHFA